METKSFNIQHKDGSSVQLKLFSDEALDSPHIMYLLPNGKSLFSVKFLSMKQLEHKERINILTTFPVVVICDHFHSPQNIGLAFRICENMGVGHLYFIGSEGIHSKSKIKKTARSSEKLVPYSYHEDSSELVLQLEKEEYAIVGIEITNRSKCLYELDINAFPKIALVLGSERSGISESLLAKIKYCFHIPMYGQISSMNVGMAMAISLYEITKQWSMSK